MWISDHPASPEPGGETLLSNRGKCDESSTTFKRSFENKFVRKHERGYQVDLHPRGLKVQLNSHRGVK